MGCALAGCAFGGSDEGGGKPVARAYDQVLTWSDLRHVVPLESSVTDSMALADQYIEAWLKQQVILHIAERNQMAEGLNMEDQIEDYRRSLVIFNYEQALVEQKLDTAVSHTEIEGYYAEHQANFELKETIVRLRWFKVNDPDDRLVRKMEHRFLHGDLSDLRDLELWLASSGVSIVDRSSTWTPRPMALADMVLPEEERSRAITQAGRQVIHAGQGAWFIDVVELRGQNSVSPIEMVRTDIRSILLNQRKIKLIGDMRATIYAQAIENKDVERLAP